jgi:membrane protein involved in colicin uptake
MKVNKSTDAKVETQKNVQPTQPPRPRTLNQALEQQHLPARQMKQDGGAHHKLHANFDVKATPFGDYDSRLIEAVQQRWDDLLTNQRFAGDRTGRVQVRFRLTEDGTVQAVTIVSNEVGDLLGYLCQAAIEEAAPFGKWPDEMRQQIGKSFRDITFTFDYY